MSDNQSVKSILYIVSTEDNSKSIIGGYETVRVYGYNGIEQDIYLDNTNENGYVTGLQLMKILKNAKKPCDINWGFSYNKNNKIYHSILYQNVEQRNAAAKRDIGYDFDKVEAVNISDLNLSSSFNFIQNVKSVAYIMGDVYDGLGFGIVEKYIAVKTIDEHKNVDTIFLSDNDEKKSYTYNELMQRIANNGYLGIRWGYKYTSEGREVYSQTFNDISLRNMHSIKEIGYNFDEEESINLNVMFKNIEPKSYSRISDVKSIVYIMEGTHIEEYQVSCYNDEANEKRDKLFKQVDRKVIGSYINKKVIGVNGMTQDIYLDSTNEKGFLTASELRKKLLNIGKYIEIGWGYAYKKDNKAYSFSNIYNSVEKRNDMALKEIDYDFNKENISDIMEVLTNISSETLDQNVKKIG